MELDGQKGEANPASIIGAAMTNRARLQDQLCGIERLAYDLETTYLQESAQYGSVLKGFEGYLSSTKSTILKRSKRVRPKDRMFSLSSVTSLASEEQQLTARYDGCSTSLPGHPRFGGFAASGQEKSKKSGTIVRKEGKKLRLNKRALDGER